MDELSKLSDASSLIVPLRFSHYSALCRFPNNINLWTRIIDNSPTIQEHAIRDGHRKNWEVATTFAVNSKFPGTYFLRLKPDDKVLFEFTKLLVIADMPDDVFSYLCLRFYNLTHNLPFLTIVLNDRLEITGKHVEFSYEERNVKIKAALNQYRNESFIEDVMKTLGIDT